MKNRCLTFDPDQAYEHPIGGPCCLKCFDNAEIRITYHKLVEIIVQLAQDERKAEKEAEDMLLLKKARPGPLHVKIGR